MSDLSEFGAANVEAATRPSRVNTLHASHGIPADNDDDKDPAPRLAQWAVAGPREYCGVAATVGKLPSGVYSVDMNARGEILFAKADTKVDNLMNFPDSLNDGILREIEDFWSRGPRFREFGFLHRRGYLFYGPQGSGKTGLVQQIIARVVASGDTVLLCTNPALLVEALTVYRQIEPERRVVCVFEDIDAIIHEHGEDRLLALLDGENQIDRVLNIATTNYPERLDKRLVARPRRFDRVIKIGMPKESVRRLYLQEKVGKSISAEELDRWVAQTDGISFASMAELVISVQCLGNTFDDTLKLLRAMTAKKVSSEEFEDSKLGFGR